jgi:hypothetical protein
VSVNKGDTGFVLLFMLVNECMLVHGWIYGSADRG